MSDEELIEKAGSAPDLVIPNACHYCGWEHSPRDHTTDRQDGSK